MVVSKGVGSLPQGRVSSGEAGGCVGAHPSHLEALPHFIHPLHQVPSPPPPHDGGVCALVRLRHLGARTNREIPQLSAITGRNYLLL